MKTVTYNVNGIRSAISKGFLEWIKTENPDILCLQEVKANADQIDMSLFSDLGYEYIYWFGAEKKGYSGVAVLSKQKAKHIEIGCGEEKYDKEGRTLLAHFDTFSQLCVYMPSGSSGDERQSFKMEWLEYFKTYAKSLVEKYPTLIMSGDYNICHKPIDIHNPVSNAKSSGFLPEERQWFSEFLDCGFIDTFRVFNQNPHQYTWWSYRAGARMKNLGWRIDYHICGAEMVHSLKDCQILPQVNHSDHCPVLLEFDTNVLQTR